MTVSAPVELPGMSRAGSKQKDITRPIVATSIGNGARKSGNSAEGSMCDN